MGAASWLPPEGGGRLMAEQHHLGADMKSQIEGAVKEKEKIAEGKAAFDAKKPDMFKEIQAKAKEKEEIAKGKEQYEAKKPELFKEIKEKVDKK